MIRRADGASFTRADDIGRHVIDNVSTVSFLNLPFVETAYILFTSLLDILLTVCKQSLLRLYDKPL